MQFIEYCRRLCMTHIETLLMNTVRDAVLQLQRNGVGYIDFETDGNINYNIDGKLYYISVFESKTYGIDAEERDDKNGHN